jgi:hypothetical protein
MGTRDRGNRIDGEMRRTGSYGLWAHNGRKKPPPPRHTTPPQVLFFAENEIF